ncbi:MAG: hypothetical protein OXN93_01620 [bacterium]|nr:hypothetical protein [bacterium]
MIAWEAWAVAGLMVAGVATVVLAPSQAVREAEALTAMGWPPGRVTAVGWAVTVAIGLGVGGLVWAVVGFGPALVWLVAAMNWLGRIVVATLRAGVLGGFGPARDRALLKWLRGVRLASGSADPLQSAVVEAAEKVQDRAFGPVKSAISRALSSGKNPLYAVEKVLRGSPAEAMVSMLSTIDRSGGRVMEQIDEVLADVVGELSATRREEVERLGRSVEAAGATSVVIAVAVLMFAVVSATFTF